MKLTKKTRKNNKFSKINLKKKSFIVMFFFSKKTLLRTQMKKKIKIKKKFNLKQINLIILE